MILYLLRFRFPKRKGIVKIKVSYIKKIIIKPLLNLSKIIYNIYIIKASWLKCGNFIISSFNMLRKKNLWANSGKHYNVKKNFLYVFSAKFDWFRYNPASGRGRQAGVPHHTTHGHSHQAYTLRLQSLNKPPIFFWPSKKKSFKKYFFPYWPAL